MRSTPAGGNRPLAWLDLNHPPSPSVHEVDVVFAYDPKASTLVGAKVGEPCTDQDYERLVESITRLVAETPAKGLACFVLIIEPSQPPPSAVWRKRIAQAEVTSKAFRFAIVSSSLAERGTATAIRWLRPPMAEQKVATIETFPEAVAWLEAEAGPRPSLHTLYARVREQTRRPGAGPPRSEGRLRPHPPVERPPADAGPQSSPGDVLGKTRLRP